MSTTKREPLKAGDRSVLYRGSNFGGCVREACTIVDVSEDGILVRVDNPKNRPLCHDIRWHPRQLSRLKPPKPLREMHVNCYPNGAMNAHPTEAEAIRCVTPGGKTVLFREVRK